MEPGFLVAPEQVVNPRQLQPDPGQVRPNGEDCLEALRGLGSKPSRTSALPSRNSRSIRSSSSRGFTYSRTSLASCQR